MKKQKKSKFSIIPPVFFVSACLLLLGLLMYGIELPYVGYNAWNFNSYSLIAHNYNTFGFFATKFAPIVSVSSDLPSYPAYYLNHPPFLSILIALFFRIVGESFWAGRVVNIAAAFLSCLLLYGIAKQISGAFYARFVFGLCLLIPAIAVWGRMIGQESLLLFFALLCLYTSLLFLQTRRRLWLVIGTASIVLGTLTDWAMVYFTICMMILFVKKAKIIGLIGLAVSITVASFYLVYVGVIAGNSTFLINGFLNRSAGQLLQMENWGFVWTATILLRMLIYFSPFVLALFLVYLVRLRRPEQREGVAVIALLFLFGFVHVLLYPEGSYGHPYWLYYLFPSVALGAGYVLKMLWTHQKLIVIGGVVFSVMYAFGIVHWKTQEVIGNVFRYELAALGSSSIPDYAPILINRTGIIDPDLMHYSFRHPTVILESTQKMLPNVSFDVIVFTCLPSCQDEKQRKLFIDTYAGTRYLGRNVEMLVLRKDGKKNPEIVTKQIGVSLPESSQSFFSLLYQRGMTLLSTPQL